MPSTTNLHLKPNARFSSQVLTDTELNRSFRIIRIGDGEKNDVTLFVTDEQARELASTILSALYPVTAAMAESEGETVQ